MIEGFKSFDLQTSKTPQVTIHGVHAGSGPPLLLLHGFPQTHIIWRKVAPQLKQHYSVIATDLRGYGASSKPEALGPTDHRLMAKSALAADCASVMKQLGCSSYFVCGHDRGARVAHKLCVDSPEQVKKVMLLDICPTKAMYESTNMMLAKAYWHWFFFIQPSPLPEKAIVNSPEVISSRMIAGMHAGPDTFGKEALEVYTKMLGDEKSVHAMCEDYRSSAQEDIAESTEDLEKGRLIKCPLRALWGKYGVIEKGFDAKKEWSKVSEKGMVDLDGSTVVDCGHYIPEEKPEELLANVMQFFKT